MNGISGSCFGWSKFSPNHFFLNHPEMAAPVDNQSRGVWSAHVTCWCESFINQAWIDPLWVQQSHDWPINSNCAHCKEPPCWICHEWRRFWVNEASGRCQWAQHANPASGTTELLLGATTEVRVCQAHKRTQRSVLRKLSKGHRGRTTLK